MWALILAIFASFTFGGGSPASQLTSLFSTASQTGDVVDCAPGIKSLSENGLPQTSTLQLASFSCQTKQPLTSCGTEGSEVMLVIDRSGSMRAREPDGREKLAWAKEAAISFVETAAQSAAGQANKIHIGVVSFGDQGANTSVDASLSNNLADVKSQIDHVGPASGSTCIECGLRVANNEFDHNSTNDSGLSQAVILLSDGRANRVWQGESPGEAVSSQAAIAEATKGKTEKMLSYYVVGFGENAAQTVLTEIASDPDESYYRYRPDVATWAATFAEFFYSICPE